MPDVLIQSDRISGLTNVTPSPRAATGRARGLTRSSLHVDAAPGRWERAAHASAMAPQHNDRGECIVVEAREAKESRNAGGGDYGAVLARVGRHHLKSRRDAQRSVDRARLARPLVLGARRAGAASAGGLGLRAPRYSVRGAPAQRANPRHPLLLASTWGERRQRANPRHPLLLASTWGERRGSNPRHPGPQPGALPIELRPPWNVCLHEGASARNGAARGIGVSPS